MLRILGSPRIDGNMPGWPTLPLRALVAAALIDLRYAGRVERRTLADALWPDADSNLANRSLRQLLLLVRNWEAMSTRRLFVVDARTVTRDRSTVRTDAAALMDAGVPGTEAELKALAALYRGDLLPGVSGLGEDPDAWVDAQRAALQQRFVRLALEGARRVGGLEAESLLRRLAYELPHEEEIEATLLALLTNERPLALPAEFADYERRLRQEVDTLPSARIRSAAAQPAAEIATLQRPLAPDVVDPEARVFRSVPRLLIISPVADSESPAGARRLAAAFVDDVILHLCTMRSFAVFAPHTARQFARKGSRPVMPAADYVMNTWLRSMPGLDRLAVTLTRSSTSEVLFAEAFTFVDRLLPGQREAVVTALVARVASAVERAERAEMRRTGEANAYVHFLLGADNLRTLELANVRRARKHFKKATDLSPEFTSALGMLARSMCLEWVLLDRKEDDLLKSALGLAERAVRIDPLDPAGHREIGHAKLYLNALDESVEHLQHAAGQAPHHADILVDQADALLHSMRDLPMAADLMGRALQLNPLAPDAYHWIGGSIDFFRSDPQRALDQLMKLENKAPAARLIAAVAAAAGDLAIASTYRDVFLSRHPEFRLAEWYMPMRGEAEREMYLSALKLAGFR